MTHIREKLPDMKARLNTLMGQTQQELNAFGDATFLGEQHRVGQSKPTQAYKAGVAHPQTHDGVLQRLRLIHRWDFIRDLHEGALRRSSYLLHLQRGLRPCLTLHRSNSEPLALRYPYCYPQLDRAEAESVRSRGGFRLACQAANQTA